MARDTKRRFVITVKGLDREVFSAFERSNGDLLINMRPLTNFPDGTRTKYQRFSVHRSLNSDPPLCTIKHTLGLEDGREITTVQVGSRKDAPFQALLFTRVGPSFEPDRYMARPRAGDQVVRLHPDETVPFTVVIAVAVAAKGGSNNLLDGINLTVVVSTFNYFHLQIGIGFIPVPPFEEGVVSHTMTSSPRVSGVPIFGIQSSDVQNLSVDEIRERAIISMMGGADYIRNKLFDGDRFNILQEYGLEKSMIVKNAFNLLFPSPAFPTNLINPYQ